MTEAGDYWRRGAGLTNITPAGKAWPEGEDFPGFLAGLIGFASVLEFGCGPGRLAKVFLPSQYVGVDICAKAIDIARAALPEHRFQLIDDDQQVLPEADVTLAHTVLLHVPDGQLPALVERFRSLRVIVSEILGRHWRRAGDPPVFNREVDDYEMAFAPRYRLMSHTRRPYPHYQNTDLSVMEFVQC